MSRALPARSAINRKFTWNAKSVFATPAAWDAELAAVLAGIPEIQARRDTMRNDRVALAALGAGPVAAGAVLGGAGARPGLAGVVQGAGVGVVAERALGLVGAGGRRLDHEGVGIAAVKLQRRVGRGDGAL